MISLPDLIDDARRLLATNTVRALAGIAVTLALHWLGIPQAIGGDAAQSILYAIDYALVAWAMLARARASGPVPIGRAGREHRARLADQAAQTAVEQERNAQREAAHAAR